LTRAYEDTAQWDKAIDGLQLADVVHAQASALRAALKANGARGYWRARLASPLGQKNPENYASAVYHRRLGQTDRALERLAMALQMHEPDLTYVKGEPACDGMHSNPRFRALTGALKLP